MCFRLEIIQKKVAGDMARPCGWRHGPCQSVWQKQQTGRLGSSTVVPPHARVVPISLVFGTSLNNGMAVPDIFAQDLHIFGLNQLQNPFLLLQDSIFHIFVPEIK